MSRIKIIECLIEKDVIFTLKWKLTFSLIIVRYLLEENIMEGVWS